MRAEPGEPPVQHTQHAVARTVGTWRRTGGAGPLEAHVEQSGTGNAKRRADRQDVAAIGIGAARQPAPADGIAETQRGGRVDATADREQRLRPRTLALQQLQRSFRVDIDERDRRQGASGHGASLPLMLVRGTRGIAAYGTV
jgi:hypothetical protein